KINKKIQNAYKLFYIKRLFSAAAILLLLLLGTFFVQLHWNKKTKITKAGNHKQVQDASPAAVRAVLTLADGSKITLDPSKNGQLARQGNTVISKNNGKISYQGKKVSQLSYNILSTGRGEQSPSLILSDGTKVWLNAASSIRFPVAFLGDTRQVELTGEAYFEVAKNPHRPFIVKASKSSITVLGTHFDVMSYKDEPYVKATLLEGSIQFTCDKEEKLLKPGQQGKVNQNGGIIQVKKVDTDNAVDWMHGQLSLNSLDVKAMMREISRWYDVDIRYVGVAPKLSFSGSISRNLDLSNILTALDANGIRTQLKNKILTVYGN
ncbi:FecR family protein, partial [Arachidicoccus sp.]|uniref:FecR family protein n=1 Tax=Arachidicoccus sp. TaxID=1872624 RepID=UPI003D2314F1